MLVISAVATRYEKTAFVYVCLKSNKHKLEIYHTKLYRHSNSN